MLLDDCILVTGSSGLLGSPLVRLLKAKGFKNVLTPASKELNLCLQQDVQDYFERHRPRYVFHLAGNVGGIQYNEQNMSRLLYENMMISFNVIHSAFLVGVKKLLNFGSSCAYSPELDPPYEVEDLGQRAPAKGNEGFALAKIAAVKLCRFYSEDHGCHFQSLVIANVYGPDDRWSETDAHVIPSVMTKMIRAQAMGKPQVNLWASETQREFIFSEDVARAALFVMLNDAESRPLNVGSGYMVDMKTLCQLIKDITGYQGEMVFHENKHVGVKSRQVNWDEIRRLGWKPTVSFMEGLERVYQAAAQSIL